MCEAKSIVQKMMDLCNEAEKDFDKFSERLSTLEKMQQDILHMIENDKFNAAEGYFYAKKLQEIRQERRNIKIELDTMLAFKPYLGNIKKLVGNASEKVVQLDNKLIYLKENKVYKPRVIENAI